MIITCPECQSQYRLADETLGSAGKDVRCTTCRHTWFQAPRTASVGEVPVSVTAASDELPAVPAGVLPDAEISPAVPATVTVDTFQSLVKQADDHPATPPEVVTPGATDFKAPSVAYAAMGNVSSAQFGVLTFFLFLFATLLPVFLFKSVFVRHVPSMVALYNGIGFDIPAPGEGFRINEMDAEYQIDKDKKTLVVKAKLANISEKPMKYPPLKVVLVDQKENSLKEWTVEDDAAKDLASGETVPVKLEFKDAPDGGVNARIRVAEK